MRLFPSPSLRAAIGGLLSITALHAADSSYAPPLSPRQTYSFNTDWRFLRADAPGADAEAFDDSKWQTVSTPHTWNDMDTYRAIINHSSGDVSGQYMGIGWYRKHFHLPKSAADGKVFIEFEGLKQAARFWVNGKPAGLFENGVTAVGLDVTGLVRFGDQDNVLSVKVDNSNDYKEEATGTEFEWMGKAFNPNYGGLNHDVWLHLSGRIYQTLPLYENLKTSGIYVHAGNFDVAKGACDVTVESQLRNESADQASSTVTTVIVDDKGIERTRFTSEAVDQVAGETDVVTATGRLEEARFWSPESPTLYDVYTIVTTGDRVVDVCRTRTGFRHAEFKGGAGTGGVWINGRFTYLQGFAQRSVDDWAGLGQAYPDWMHAYNAGMIRSTHSNFIRWMHIAPQRVDVSACDSAGIVEVCPAGDKEKDVTGRQWEQRKELMRDTLIYYRDQPSIFFWEAGNNSITPDHMKQMVDLRAQWDPAGERVMGCRTLNDTAATPIAEYYGVMIGQDPRTDALKSPTDLFRAYSGERRDRAPLIETEDFREEAARRYWDKESPPHFGFKKGPSDTWEFDSESFCLAGVERWDEYYRNRISNTDPAHAKWSGYASIYWSDSNADGRQDSSEVCRVSGKVDSVRLPKELYYVERVMQSGSPDLHIIGHWTYPPGTKKTVYVAASHCDSVRLSVNGRTLGIQTSPQDDFLYPFPDVAFEAGRLTAEALDHGKVVSSQTLETAGPAVALRLTPITGSKGFQADGSDVLLLDVEAIDATGRRCPTDEASVSFGVEGPVIWRGGYNSGVIKSTNATTLLTECGVNRVAIRSTLKPGTVHVTASRPGLKTAEISVEVHTVPIQDGLSGGPQASAGPIESGPLR